MMIIKTSSPLVSVVLPTKNSASYLQKCLGSLRAQTYQDFELIVVDECSSDATQAIVQKYTTHFYKRDGGKSAARNFGTGVARGKYVLHIDADMILTPRVIEECVLVADSASADAVVIQEDQESDHFWLSRVLSLEKKMAAFDENIVAPRFINRHRYLELGGMDVRLDPIDEGDLQAKLLEANCVIKSIKPVIVIQNDESRSKYLLRRLKGKFERGRKKALFLHLHPVSKQLQWNKRISIYVLHAALLLGHFFDSFGLLVLKFYDLLFFMAGGLFINKVDRQTISDIRNQRIFTTEATTYQTEFFEATEGGKFVDQIEKKVVSELINKVTYPPKKILDIGAGGGRWSRLLLETFPDAQVTACDLSAAMLGQLQNKFASYGDRFQTVKSDMQQLALSDREFDLVVSIRAIKYAANQDRVFSEIQRVLKPGGVAVIELPYFNFIYQFIRSINIFGSLSEYARRIQLRSLKTIGQSLRFAGFEIATERVEFTVPATFFKLLGTNWQKSLCAWIDQQLPKWLLGRSVFYALKQSTQAKEWGTQKIAVVIATKNRYDMLNKELECLKRQTYKNFEVFIVDDVSSDETATFEPTQKKWGFPISIFHSQRALSMIKARNRGLKMAGSGFDNFIILDDDNVFENTFIGSLADYSDRYPQIGIIGTKNYHKDGKKPWYFGCNYHMPSLLPSFVRREFAGDFIVVDSVANCFMISNSVFRKNGYFDEKYVIDFSESEYCFRARNSGYLTGVVAVPITHQSSTGSEALEMFRKRINERPETYFYTYRNKYVFSRTFANWLDQLLYITFWQFVNLGWYMYVSITLQSLRLWRLYWAGFLAGNTFWRSGKLVSFNRDVYDS